MHAWLYCPLEVVLGAGVAEGGAAEALLGIFNFCPTTILSVFKLFSERRALTVVPNWEAILVRLSPDLTV
jgi:hypothetical protein